MSQTYKVKIVNDKEWKEIVHSDKRYEHVDQSNLGFADPKRHVAYARESYLTLYPGVRRYVVQHEFEHLISDEKLHEDEHGIRHKKFFKQVALPILGAGLGTFLGGPLGGALGGALGGTTGTAIGTSLGQAAGAGLGGYGGARLGGAPSPAALTTGASSAAGAFTGGGGLGNLSALLTQPTQPAAAQLTQAVRPTPPYDAAAYGGFINRFPGIGQVTPQTQFSVLSSPPGAGAQRGIGSSLSNLATGIQSGIPTATGQQPPPPPPPGGGGFGAGFGQGIRQFLGASLPSSLGTATGQAFGQYLGSNVGNIAQLATAAGALGIGQQSRSAQIPPVPDLTQLPRIQNIAQTAGQGQSVSPLGQFGQQQLTARLNTPFQGVNPLVLQSIRDTFDRQRRDFASQFKTIRPNADIASDADYARNLSLIDRQEAQAVGQVQQQEFERFQTQRTGDIAAALGIDNRTLGVLMDVAQLDVDRIQAQFGISAQQAQQFKNTFGQLGAMLAARPLGLTSLHQGVF